jgi:hypothetical protein
MTGVASCPKLIWIRITETLKFLTSDRYTKIDGVWQLLQKTE